MIRLQDRRLAGAADRRVTLAVVHRDDEAGTGQFDTDSTGFAPHGGIQNHIALDRCLDESGVLVDLPLRGRRCGLAAGIGFRLQLLLHHGFHLFLQLGLLGRLALALCLYLGLLVSLGLRLLLCVSFCLLCGFICSLFLCLSLGLLLGFRLGFLLSLGLGLLVGFSLLGRIRLRLGFLFGLLLLQLFFLFLERQRLGKFFFLTLGFSLLGLLRLQLAGFLGLLGLFFRLLLLGDLLLLFGLGLAGGLFSLLALGLGDAQTLLLLRQLAPP